MTDTRRWNLSFGTSICLRVLLLLFPCVHDGLVIGDLGEPLRYQMCLVYPSGRLCPHVSQLVQLSLYRSGHSADALASANVFGVSGCALYKLCGPRFNVMSMIPLSLVLLLFVCRSVTVSAFPSPSHRV
ncbi:hypothetical protein M378DRAFT_738503 [Amanita muscaria Koide BX008]|uniref:Secreted protein n=1 Tax=Amanita muscaria (strain Koide BX008) TaxID=946122 RepID=A0A0C2SI72_AMAMK|nr:hypothetical protein M378DRAFT_738503 [Amanita muscaria Koide BX008]